jgi:hypothetical protein
MSSSFYEGSPLINCWGRGQSFMYFLGFYGYGKSGIICWNIIYWTTINPSFTVRGIIWLSGKFGCHGSMNSYFMMVAGLNQFWASSCVAATSNCTHLMKCIWKVQGYRVGTHKVRWTKKPLKTIFSEIFWRKLNTGVFLEQYTQNSPDHFIHVTLISCLIRWIWTVAFATLVTRIFVEDRFANLLKWINIQSTIISQRTKCVAATLSNKH